MLSIQITQLFLSWPMLTLALEEPVSLQPTVSLNRPIWLSLNFFSGTYHEVNFQFGQDTYVQGACAATLNGERYVFGASHEQYKTQFSKIEGCSLNRMGTLDFDFKLGSCGTYNFGGTPKILLCHDHSQPAACRT